MILSLLKSITNKASISDPTTDQLAMVHAVILKFDEEQEVRPLHQWELELCRALKPRVLGLASLARTIARQRSRMLFLAEGDANTRFYHLQACHRGRL